MPPAAASGKDPEAVDAGASCSPEENLSLPQGQAYLQLPIAKLIYVVGKELSFDIFLRTDRPGNLGPEYCLLFGKGEIYQPWPLLKTKATGTNFVYYHRRDQALVREYLHRSQAEARPVAPTASPAAALNAVLAGECKVASAGADLLTGDDYVPLRLFSLLPDWEIPFDLYVKTVIAGHRQPRYLRLCSRGEALAADLINKLRAKGIDKVYAPGCQLATVLQYLYHNLSLVMSDDQLSPAEKASRVYEVTLVWIRHFFEEEAENLTPNLKLGMEFVDFLFDCLRRDQDCQGWVLALLRHDGKLYTHSLNCCLIGLAFTNYLQWPPKKIRDFTLGALLHDIGMTRIPLAILRKPGALSPPEMAQVRQHPLTGYNLLSVSPLSRDSLIPILQHHENCNGSGYPDSLCQPLIDPAARILRIVDSFEALTARRPWREPFDPLKALWIMRQLWQQSGIYDTSLLSAFIQFLAKDAAAMAV